MLILIHFSFEWKVATIFFERPSQQLQLTVMKSKTFTKPKSKDAFWKKYCWIEMFHVLLLNIFLWRSKKRLSKLQEWSKKHKNTSQRTFNQNMHSKISGKTQIKWRDLVIELKW